MASRYDERLLEIAAQREAERAADQAGMDRIERSTQTINKGLANPLVYILGIGGIIGVPFTGGFSILALIVAILMLTGGGKAYAQAIPPTASDLAAPGPGCVRIVAALGSLILLLIVIALFGAIVAYHLGVQP